MIMIIAIIIGGGGGRRAQISFLHSPSDNKEYKRLYSATRVGGGVERDNGNVMSGCRSVVSDGGLIVLKGTQ